MTTLSRQTVLDFIAANPDATTKRDIARGLGVKGSDRAALRGILQDLESEGVLERTGKRAWANADRPPTTTVVLFERVDENGDLIGRALGQDGPYGPEIVYAGVLGRRREPAPKAGDRALCKLAESPAGWRGRMIKRLESRESVEFFGLYTMGFRGGRVVSASRKDRRELVIEPHDNTAGAEDGDLVRAAPKPTRGGRRREFGPRFGVVKEVIGKAGDPKAASLLAIHAHGIPDSFPEEVLEEAGANPEIDAVRHDLRDIPLITIDPSDARDHDDAVWAEELEDGWRVIVAIADVSAFVPEGSALDREARRRGNSTYFPDRVVPMLPEALSAGACSLREGEDRACLAVSMAFDRSGTKRDHRFVRATMRSAAKLAYGEAQDAIDGRPSPKAEPLLETVLRPLWGAYAALSKARAARGPLELELPERRVELTEDGEVRGVSVRERFDAHKLIEEFMIQANVCAAETLEAKKSPFLYRVHDQPSEAKLSDLSDFLKTLGIKWPKGERPQTSRFNRLLKQAAETDQADVISEIVLRSQSQAVYGPENIGHFGLNLRRYAHFTSPIRRYADLIVHRALIRALKLGEDGLSDELGAQLEAVSEHLVMCERRSMAAEREATDRYLALFLADRVGAEFEGRITGVTRAGLFVRLAETAADGFVPISSISDEYWVHDEAAMALVARGSGRRFELGQEVSVRLAEAAPLTGGLRLEMLSKPLKPKPRRTAERSERNPDRGERRPKRGRRR